MIKHVIFSWHDFDQWIEWCIVELESIQKTRPLHFVYGPPRGGVIPAVALSHRLGIPYVGSLSELSERLRKAEETPSNVLWVDEIVESGKTLQDFYDWASPNCPICVSWVSKVPSLKFPALHSGITIEKDTWAVFPWENPITWKRELEEYESRRQ